MKVFYIAEMNINQKGGLFNATYERLKKHSSRLDDCFIVNNNFYDSGTIRFLKKLLNKELKYAYRLSEFNKYEDIIINNLNYRRGLFYYLQRKKIAEAKNEIVNYYIKKYRNELNRADVIHAHWGYPNGYIAYKLSSEFSKPYFITFHGSDINYLNEDDYKDMVLAMENASNCFFVSKMLLDNAKKIGYSGRNAKVIYNGVDSKKFLPENKNEKPYKTVGYVGALIYIKGVDLLPHIFKEIKKISNVDVRFLIVGEGNLGDQIKLELQKQKNIQVEFKGSIEPDRVPLVMKDIDVLVVPSRNEGLGMVILEGNAMNIPVVGTKVGGIPEAIGIEDNIVDFDENIVGNMASRVVQILQDSTSNSKKYRDRITRIFNWSQIVEEEITSYKESLPNNKVDNVHVK